MFDPFPAGQNAFVESRSGIEFLPGEVKNEVRQWITGSLATLVSAEKRLTVLSVLLTGEYPAIPALQGRVKGYNINTMPESFALQGGELYKFITK